MSYAATFIKDPDAILDYAIDWTEWLNSDSILTSSWSAVDGMSIDDTNNSDEVSVVWLSGGTTGRSYAVTNRITTAEGRQDDRTILIRCQQR